MRLKHLLLLLPITFLLLSCVGKKKSVRIKQRQTKPPPVIIKQQPMKNYDEQLQKLNDKIKKLEEADININETQEFKKLKNEINSQKSLVDIQKVEIEKLKKEIEKLNEQEKIFEKKIKINKSAYKKLTQKIKPKYKYKKTTPSLKEKKNIQKPIETKTITLKKNQSSTIIYNKAVSFFNKRQYDIAIKHLKDFLKNTPPYDYIDNAHFWLGESYYMQKKYNYAILEYAIVIDNYPNGNKLNDSILKIALSYLKIKDKNKAVFYLETLNFNSKTKNKTILRAKALLEKLK